jgi:hypothetical protein
MLKIIFGLLLSLVATFQVAANDKVEFDFSTFEQPVQQDFWKPKYNVQDLFQKNSDFFDQQETFTLSYKRFSYTETWDKRDGNFFQRTKSERGIVLFRQYDEMDNTGWQISLKQFRSKPKEKNVFFDLIPGKTSRSYGFEFKYRFK